MTVAEWLQTHHAAGAQGARPTVLPTLSRNDLPTLARDLGFTRGAEIGVWKAGYSVRFCQQAPAMHLLCVDPWAKADDWLDGKNTTQENIEAAYQEARVKLAGYNATIARTDSLEVAKNLPDRSLDFVYIDGNHSFHHVLADLTDWSPKVRTGGVVAGHDYRAREDKPYIQVIPAVQAYTEQFGIETWFTTGADRTPSFLWVKP